MSINEHFIRNGVGISFNDFIISYTYILFRLKAKITSLGPVASAKAWNNNLPCITSTKTKSSNEKSSRNVQITPTNKAVQWQTNKKWNKMHSNPPRINLFGKKNKTNNFPHDSTLKSATRPELLHYQLSEDGKKREKKYTADPPQPLNPLGTSERSFQMSRCTACTVRQKQRQ